MRGLVSAFIVLTLLLAAPAARAAPTCDDINGGTIRCGTPGAMPVGWSPPADQALLRLEARPADLQPDELAALIVLVGAVFALIALMPPFDGRDPGDWDEQEGDGEERPGGRLSKP